jgi:hypothetical protein
LKLSRLKYVGTNLFDVLRCGRDVAALAAGAILDEDQVPLLKNDVLDVI